ncbi:unnamed protein product, partial [Ectocarpus sp. 4 AP-2014]
AKARKSRWVTRKSIGCEKGKRTGTTRRNEEQEKTGEARRPGVVTGSAGDAGVHWNDIVIEQRDTRGHREQETRRDYKKNAIRGRPGNQRKAEISADKGRTDGAGCC